ncbi:MAG: hypothetical protein WC851_01180 [Candidatus Shapirobacteria bacterium]|jgi:uncharacterized repeat protein (TIGR01451 family)
MKTKTIVALLLAIGVFCTPADVMAQYYGNDSSTPIIVVDKKIKLPNSDKLLDNISKSDHVYTEGEQIEFSIAVENRGSNTVYDLNVVDKLPSYLKLQYFFGKVSADKTNVETVIPVLKPGEKKNYYMIALVKDLPKSSYTQTIKLTNNVCAKNTTVSDCDNATYFAQKPSMPVTGSSDSLILNSALILSLTSGALVLRKLIRGY